MFHFHSRRWRLVLPGITSALLMSASLQATDWTWTGQANPTSENWSGTRRIGTDSEGRAININNWGYSGIDTLATPGGDITDNVRIGSPYTAQIGATQSPSINTLQLDSGAILDISDGGNLTLNGSPQIINGQMLIHYGGWDGAGILTFPATTTVSGSGQIQFQSAATINGNGSLTVANGVTMHGYGATINVPLNNAALLDADYTNGWIYLKTNPKSNSGTFKASNGGSLGIYTAILQTGAGQLTADNGTIQLFNGGSLTGGITTTSNNGSLFVNGGGVNVGITDITNQGSWLIQDGSVASFTGATFTNNGTFTIGGYTGGSGWATMRLAGNILATGSGSIKLEPGYMDSTNNSTLTNAAGHTIQGYGEILNAITNNGSILANTSTQPLVLRNSAKTNNSVINAASGGFLDLRTTINQSPSGSISAADGSTVRLYSGSAISGGTLSSSGTGSFAITNGGVTTTLTDVTNQASWLAQDGSIVNLAGSSLSNTGTITVGGYTGGSGWARLRLATDVTASGNGTIRLDPGYIDSTNGSTLTNAAGHTIQGYGEILNAITNNGSILANSSNRPLILRDTANNSVINATSGGFLDIRTTINQSPSGSISAGDASAVRLYGGSAISGGTLSSSGTGSFAITGGSVTTTLTDVTNQASWLAQDGSIVNLAGSGLINTGTVTIGGYTGGSGIPRLRLAADVTASGSGIILLNPGYIDSLASRTLTNAADHSILGYGEITAAITNRGLINADRTGNLILSTTTKTNSGTIKASNGRNLEIRTTINQESPGKIQADGATVNLENGAAINGGTLESPNGGRFYSTDGQIAILNNVTNSGQIFGQNCAQFQLTGSTFTNNGALEIGGYTGGCGYAYVQPANGLTLQGTGTLLMDSGYITGATGTSMINASQHTIRGGYGRIYGYVVLDNRGTVEAYNGTLDIDGSPTQFSGSILTGGTWKATNGALNVAGAGSVTTNQGSVIFTGSGTFPKINTLATNEGLLSLYEGSNFTTAAALTNQGTIHVGANCTLTVKGSFTVGSASLTQLEGQLIVTSGT